MSETQNNICIINAQSGIYGASPQISRFTHNCDCIKFIVNKDFRNCAVVVITSIGAKVGVVPEGDYLEKTYDEKSGQTSLLWKLDSAVTSQSGCVIYQIAAYSTDEEKKTIWYSKEGRLIVTDSIETDDYSADAIGESANLVIQILTLAKSLELSKVDKEEGKSLSTNDFTDSEKENLASLVSDNAANKQSILHNSSAISEIRKFFDDYKSEIHPGEESYNPESKKAQSGKAVAEAIAGIVNSAPETLDTLSELSKALGDDPNFSASIMELLGNKVNSEHLESVILQINDILELHRSYIDKKIDKADGKGLSTNDFTNEDKALISAHGETISKHDEAIAKKVDKVDGKGLSTNDFTDEYKQKVDDLSDTDGGDIPGIVDLGFFDSFSAISEALEDVTLESGIYKAKYSVNEFVQDEVIIAYTKTFLDGEVEEASQILFMTGGLPVYRQYGAVYGDDAGWKWGRWEYRFQDTNAKTDSIEGNGGSESYPSTKAVADYVTSRLYPVPEYDVPATLEANTEYCLEFREELRLSFPDASHCSAGDVIYVTFFCYDNPTNLVIDTTNTYDIDISVEPNTGYEVFAKYDGIKWILNYSEFTLL